MPITFPFHGPHINMRETDKCHLWDQGEGENLASSFCHMEPFGSHEPMPTCVSEKLSGQHLRGKGQQPVIYLLNIYAELKYVSDTALSDFQIITHLILIQPYGEGPIIILISRWKTEAQSS